MPIQIDVAHTNVLLNNAPLSGIGTYQPTGLTRGLPPLPPGLFGNTSPFLVTVNVRSVMVLSPGAQDSWVTIALANTAGNPSNYQIIDGTQSLVGFLPAATTPVNQQFQFSAGFSFSLVASDPLGGGNISVFAAAYGGPFNYVDIHSDGNGHSSLTLYGGTPIATPFIVGGQRDSNGQPSGTAIPALTNLLSGLQSYGMIVDNTTP